MTRVSLRFDSGPTTGLGHQSRMKALGAGFTSLEVEIDLAEVGTQTAAEIIVLDTYGPVSRGDYPASRITCVIDDLERSLDVEVVVDPTPTDEGLTIVSRGSPSILRGSGFSLVDPQLALMKRRSIGSHVKNVLVATGGGPDNGLGMAIAGQLVECAPELRVLLATRDESSFLLPKLEIVNTDQGLAKWLSHSDLVITAGGVTMIEALTLGRPTVAFDLHKNQARAVDHCARLGCIVRSSPSATIDHTLALLDDEDARRRLGDRAIRLFDGKGPRRVADFLLSQAG
ncbi:MAG: hypothetical protein KY429_07575 [Actinobacteria bacterium]|nr:hypothetical protein [Actinomycetota bacterium]